MTDNQLRIFLILVAITAIIAAAIAIYRRISQDEKNKSAGPSLAPDKPSLSKEDIDRILKGPGIKHIGPKNS